MLKIFQKNKDKKELYRKLMIKDELLVKIANQNRILVNALDVIARADPAAGELMKEYARLVLKEVGMVIVGVE